MKLEALTRLLGKKSSKPHNPEQTAAALAEVDAELELARRALAQAETSHDAGVVEAVAANDTVALDKLRQSVEEARRRVDLLQVTRAAVERRHQAAQAAQEARGLAERWGRAREAADERRAALVKLDAALDTAAEAIREANGALARCVDLLPVRLSYYPDGWPAHELATLVTMKLSAQTNGAIRSAMPLSPFELGKLPGMVDRHDKGAAQVFAGAPTFTAAQEA